jgi:predicted Zn-dependent peptidase
MQRQNHRTVLANGIVVLVVENPTADIVATRCFFRGGSSLESQPQAGISHLVASLITKGTANFSSQEIAEQVESIGASLGTDAASDYFLLSFKTIGVDFAEILHLAAEILRSPTFPDYELELERRLTLQAIASQQERPFSIAYDRLQPLVYGDHPYGFPGLGTVKTVSGLSQADLIQFQQTQFRPDCLVISIAGRISADRAIAQIEKAFGDWQIPDRLFTIPRVTAQFSPKIVSTPQDTQQAIVMLGYPAPAVTSQDYAAMKLITTHLGNGLSSRLFVELREKRGLAYEVSAFYPTRLDISQFVAYMGTAPQNTQLALEGLRSECDRLIHVALLPEELQTAKSKLLGQYALGKQTNGQIAQIFGWYETLGLGMEFDREFATTIEAVTLEDIQIAASTYLCTPAISLVVPANALAIEA